MAYLRRDVFANVNHVYLQSTRVQVGLDGMEDVQMDGQVDAIRDYFFNNGSNSRHSFILAAERTRWERR